MKTIPDVKLTTEGTTGRLTISGEDVTRAVRGGTLSFGNGEVPIMRLELNAVHGEFGTNFVDLRLSDEVCRLLVLLGWRPPAGEVS